jgi:DNA-binding response OmpR family regulator
MAPRALVVADDAPLSTLLEYHLRKEGFEVHVAPTARGAEAAAALAPPALLVVDTDLGGFGMVAVCRSVLDSPELRRAFVLALVGGAEDRASLARLGFHPDAVLAKPFTLEELGRAVGTARCRVPVTDSPYPDPRRTAAE